MAPDSPDPSRSSVSQVRMLVAKHSAELDSLTSHWQGQITSLRVKQQEEYGMLIKEIEQIESRKETEEGPSLGRPVSVARPAPVEPESELHSFRVKFLGGVVLTIRLVTGDYVDTALPDCLFTSSDEKVDPIAPRPLFFSPTGLFSSPPRFSLVGARGTSCSTCRWGSGR